MASTKEIAVAIAFYYGGGEDLNHSIPAVRDAKMKLLRSGLLQEVNGRFVKTEALDVYVQALLAIPFPVRETIWVIPK